MLRHFSIEKKIYLHDWCKLEDIAEHFVEANLVFSRFRYEELSMDMLDVKDSQDQMRYIKRTNRFGKGQYNIF